MAWTIRNLICFYNWMSRGCPVSKNMQSGLWLRFPEILSRGLALGISLVLRAASLMVFKKATNRKWGRKKENGYLPFFLKMKKNVPRSLWYLCLKQKKVIWPLLNQAFQGGNCPGVKSWPIPGAEGSSTVPEKLKQCRKAYARCQDSLGKEGGGTGGR